MVIPKMIGNSKLMDLVCSLLRRSQPRCSGGCICAILRPRTTCSWSPTQLEREWSHLVGRRLQLRVTLLAETSCFESCDYSRGPSPKCLHESSRILRSREDDRSLRLIA